MPTVTHSEAGAEATAGSLEPGTKQSEQRESSAFGSGPHAIELTDVGVCFPIPTDEIASFKEYILRRITNRIEHRELWAVRDVRLEVPRGDAVGLVGRNGAGKSTLLKVISRVLRPTTGRVIVRGRLAPLLELGAGFHFDLTGRENVFLNASLFGYPRSLVEEHFDEVIDFSELAEFIDLPVRNYSSGMLARLGFSTATLFRPDILILDEILAVGDAPFQEKCKERITAFRALGTSILLVSHEPSLIKSYCEHATWLDHGKVVVSGPVEEVMDRYEHAITHEHT